MFRSSKIENVLGFLLRHFRKDRKKERKNTERKTIKKERLFGNRFSEK